MLTIQLADSMQTVIVISIQCIINNRVPPNLFNNNRQHSLIAKVNRKEFLHIYNVTVFNRDFAIYKFMDVIF